MKRTKSVGWVLASSLALGCSSAGAGQQEPSVAADSESEPDGCVPGSRLDIRYADNGRDPRLTSLDVLVGGEVPERPIVIWVHGGGWVGGDKGSHEMNPAFARWFAERGEILVSINYRLVGDSQGTSFVEQATDVAASIAWVVDHAEEFCGDPNRVHLVGYSAGAHLVALVATDAGYLEAHDLQPEVLSSVVSLDVNAYDIPWAIDNAAEHGYPAAIRNLPAVFGEDVRAQEAASPMTHLQPQAVPPSLVISAPDQNGVVQSLSPAASQRYVEALREAGNEAEFFNAEDDSHSSLASDFGTPGDQVTDVVGAFLDDH